MDILNLVGILALIVGAIVLIVNTLRFNRPNVRKFGLISLIFGIAILLQFSIINMVLGMHFGDILATIYIMVTAFVILYALKNYKEYRYKYSWLMYFDVFLFGLLLRALITSAMMVLQYAR